MIADHLDEDCGEGLYQPSFNNREFLAYNAPALKVICSGSNSEAQWSTKEVLITPGGMRGGRAEVPKKKLCLYVVQEEDYMLFLDTTVSRNHFEIAYERNPFENYNPEERSNSKHHRSIDNDEKEGKEEEEEESLDDLAEVGEELPGVEGAGYIIKDLGSVGGTFSRIPSRRRYPLNYGSVFLIGKHQFQVVEPIDFLPLNLSELNATINQPESKDQEEEEEEEEEEGEQTPTMNQEDNDSDNDGDEKIQTPDEGIDEKDGGSPNDRETPSPSFTSPPSMDIPLDPYKQVIPHEVTPNFISPTSNMLWYWHFWNERGISRSSLPNLPQYIALRCISPTGSPLDGEIWDVKRHERFTMGRRPHNNVLFNLDAHCGKLYGIDGAISGYHATIEFDEELGGFVLFDGYIPTDEEGVELPLKESTNGTWIRLLTYPRRKRGEKAGILNRGETVEGERKREVDEGGMLHPLRAGHEILVGTVRFVVDDYSTLIEQDILPLAERIKRREATNGVNQVYITRWEDGKKKKEK